jgi:hypothetical protein
MIIIIIFKSNYLYPIVDLTDFNSKIKKKIIQIVIKLKLFT